MCDCETWPQFFPILFWEPLIGIQTGVSSDEPPAPAYASKKFLSFRE